MDEHELKTKIVKCSPDEDEVSAALVSSTVSASAIKKVKAVDAHAQTLLSLKYDDRCYPTTLPYHNTHVRPQEGKLDTHARHCGILNISKYSHK